jgi:hypothetical protein
LSPEQFTLARAGSHRCLTVRALQILRVAEMRANPLTETVRRMALAASVASIALLAFASPAALAADTHKQNWQPQWQQHPEQRLQQFQPRQQNNRVNQVQPPQQFQRQLQQQQQKRIQQNNQVLRQQQKQIYQNNRASVQAQKQFPRFNWNTYHPGQRPPQWQQYRANFDPRPYQWNRAAPRVYYVPVYRPPPGWSYRRWAYGEIYPQVYWTQPYWIGNYYTYGLPQPPYGYVWVRNGAGRHVGRYCDRPHSPGRLRAVRLRWRRTSVGPALPRSVGDVHLGVRLVIEEQRGLSDYA